MGSSEKQGGRTESAGLTFLRAARDAMPNTIGDRVRVQAMCEALSLSIRCKFKFDAADGEKLADRGWGSYAIQTSVGVFQPLDSHYYSEACVHGGTFARMWEAYTGQRPWVAPNVFGCASRGTSSVEELGENRVAVGLGVLIRRDADKDDAGLARTRDRQVWWCTSASKNEIILCRYRYEGESRYAFGRQSGAPAKRLKMNRAQWEEFVREAGPPAPTVASGSSAVAVA
jgi:hypothetical protein